MAAYASWLLSMCLFVTVDSNSITKTKRQIFREQVLPHRGGRIPDGAFNTDRLLLNHLNKEGFAIPDGVLLEHRPSHSHPQANKYDIEDEHSLIRINQQPGNKYVAPEGRYHHERPLTVPSTYIIRKPVHHADTNIKTPDQVQSLDQYILYKQLGIHHVAPPHLPSRYGSPPVHHTNILPAINSYNNPSHTSEHHHEFLVYHPSPAQFTLPHKNFQEKHLSQKYNGLENLQFDGPSGNIDWPLLPRQFGALEDFPIYNDLQYPYSVKNEEEVEPFEGFYSLESRRFYRKTPESHFKVSQNRWKNAVDIK